MISDHYSAGLIDATTVQQDQIHLDGSQSGLGGWVQLPSATGTAVSYPFKQQQVCPTAHAPDKLWNQDLLNHQSNLETLSDPNNNLLSKELTQPSLLGTDNPSSIQALNNGEIDSLDPSQVLHWNLIGDDVSPLNVLPKNQPTLGANFIRPSKYFISDANCYRRLEIELTRFVLSSLSPNNPRQHVCIGLPISNLFCLYVLILETNYGF